jgi:hypothetical protein
MATPTVVLLSTTRTNEFPPTGKRKAVDAQLTVDGTVGATPGQIPASLFGLRYIEQCSNLIQSDNSHILPCNETYDGTSLLGSTLGTGVPANIPVGTYGIVLEGY